MTSSIESRGYHFSPSSRRTTGRPSLPTTTTTTASNGCSSNRTARMIPSSYDANAANTPQQPLLHQRSNNPPVSGGSKGGGGGDVWNLVTPGVSSDDGESAKNARGRSTAAANAKPIPSPSPIVLGSNRPPQAPLGEDSKGRHPSTTRSPFQPAVPAPEPYSLYTACKPSNPIHSQIDSVLMSPGWTEDSPVAATRHQNEDLNEYQPHGSRDRKQLRAALSKIENCHGLQQQSQKGVMLHRRTKADLFSLDGKRYAIAEEITNTVDPASGDRASRRTLVRSVCTDKTRGKPATFMHQEGEIPELSEPVAAEKNSQSKTSAPGGSVEEEVHRVKVDVGERTKSPTHRVARAGGCNSAKTTRPTAVSGAKSVGAGIPSPADIPASEPTGPHEPQQQQSATLMTPTGGRRMASAAEKENVLLHNRSLRSGLQPLPTPTETTGRGTGVILPVDESVRSPAVKLRRKASQGTKANPLTKAEAKNVVGISAASACSAAEAGDQGIVVSRLPELDASQEDVIEGLEGMAVVQIRPHTFQPLTIAKPKAKARATGGSRMGGGVDIGPVRDDVSPTRDTNAASSSPTSTLKRGKASEGAVSSLSRTPTTDRPVPALDLPPADGSPQARPFHAAAKAKVRSASSGAAPPLPAKPSRAAPANAAALPASAAASRRRSAAADGAVDIRETAKSERITTTNNNNNSTAAATAVVKTDSTKTAAKTAINNKQPTTASITITTENGRDGAEGSPQQQQRMNNRGGDVNTSLSMRPFTHTTDSTAARRNSPIASGRKENAISRRISSDTMLPPTAGTRMASLSDASNHGGLLAAESNDSLRISSGASIGGSSVAGVDSDTASRVARKKFCERTLSSNKLSGMTGSYSLLGKLEPKTSTEGGPSNSMHLNSPPCSRRSDSYDSLYGDGGKRMRPPSPSNLSPRAGIKTLPKVVATTPKPSRTAGPGRTTRTPGAVATTTADNPILAALAPTLSRSTSFFDRQVTCGVLNRPIALRGLEGGQLLALAAAREGGGSSGDDEKGSVATRPRSVSAMKPESPTTKKGSKGDTTKNDDDDGGNSARSGGLGGHVRHASRHRRHSHSPSTKRSASAPAGLNPISTDKQPRPEYRASPTEIALSQFITSTPVPFGKQSHSPRGPPPPPQRQPQRKRDTAESRVDVVAQSESTTTKAITTTASAEVRNAATAPDESQQQRQQPRTDPTAGTADPRAAAVPRSLRKKKVVKDKAVKEKVVKEKAAAVKETKDRVTKSGCELAVVNEAEVEGTKDAIKEEQQQTQSPPPAAAAAGAAVATTTTATVSSPTTRTPNAVADTRGGSATAARTRKAPEIGKSIKRAMKADIPSQVDLTADGGGGVPPQHPGAGASTTTGGLRRQYTLPAVGAVIDYPGTAAKKRHASLYQGAASEFFRASTNIHPDATTTMRKSAPRVLEMPKGTLGSTRLHSRTSVTMATTATSPRGVANNNATVNNRIGNRRQGMGTVGVPPVDEEPRICVGRHKSVQTDDVEVFDAHHQQKHEQSSSLHSCNGACGGCRWHREVVYLVQRLLQLLHTQGDFHCCSATHQSPLLMADLAQAAAAAAAAGQKNDGSRCNGTPTSEQSTADNSSDHLAAVAGAVFGQSSVPHFASPRNDDE